MMCRSQLEPPSAHAAAISPALDRLVLKAHTGNGRGL